MKNFSIYCLFVLFSCPTLLPAQIHDHSIAAGFNTIGFDLQALGNGRWVAIGVGEDIPGELYRDSIIVVLFDSQGNILRRQILHVPFVPFAEVHEITSFTSTPDGGFAVSIAHNLCDAGTGAVSLLVFDPDGQLRWTRNNLSGQPSLPSLIRPAPDGNLLGIGHAAVTKFDLSNGSILFEAPIQTNLSYFYVYDLLIIPGTENLVGLGYPNMLYWEKSGTPAAPVYTLTGDNFSSSGTYNRILPGPTGTFFTFNRSNKTIYQFTVPDFVYAPVASLPTTIYDIATTGQELILLSKRNAAPALFQMAFNGSILDTVVIADSWQSIGRLSLQGDMLAVIGQSGSGPSITSQGWYPFNSNQMWLHTRPVSANNPAGPLPNAALTAVNQTVPLNVETFPISNWGVRFNYDGGQFKVQLTNTGSETLHTIDVLIGFDWATDFICYFRPVKRRRFSGLSLEPGESAWLDFGNISATFQKSPPTQFCFWTASPNEKPDADHTDDVYCLNVYTDTNVPQIGQLSIYPNPASTGFWVQQPGEAAQCHLFDLTGRLIQSSEIPAGTERFFVPTADFPNGIYWFQIGLFVEKIIIQRD